MDPLLRIDVEAEIRKLTGQRFKTPADYAVALLTWIARRRPLRVDIGITKARLSMRHDGEGVPKASMRNLAVLLDPEKPEEERHEALVAIEDDEPGLLAAFSPRRAVVRITALRNGRPARFEFTAGRGASRLDPGEGDGLGIEIRARGRDAGLERTLLEEAARYSVVPITIDGERVNRGLVLDNAILHVDLRNDRMHGVVGLPLRSDLVRVLRLRHGIRAEERILPSVGGMILHAVVDENDDDFEETMATLRRAGRRLYARLAETYGELEGGRRERAFELLIERYGHTHEARLLEGVRAFEVVNGPPLDLEGVRRLAASGPLRAISKEEPPRRYDLSGRGVLRLSPLQRRFLEGELRLRIEPPPLRRDDLGLLSRLASWWRRLAARLRPPLGGSPGRPLGSGELMPEESAFLEAVSAEIRSGAFSLPGEARPFGLRFRMAERQRRPFVRIAAPGGPGEYSVSRDHPLVRSMIAAFAEDRGFLYPALVALAHGHDGYAENRAEARRQAT